MEDKTVDSGSDVPVNIPDLSADIEINETVKHALKYLTRTKDENKNHWMPICVVYDHFVYRMGR